MSTVLQQDVDFEFEAFFVDVKTVLRPPVLARIAAGDATAVEDCLKMYGGLVWSIVKRLTKDHAEAEDAVQEIFIDLWQVAKKYDPDVASESTFITMIARRRLIDRFRKNKASRNTSSLDVREVEMAALPELNRVELADESAKAAACFQKLTGNSQKVLRLSIHHGRSHSEIAEKLSLPLGSVKSFARRGLVQLRECMQRRFSPQTAGATS
jgi:RNA polymerase sigma factor (sigma-70 family)